MNTALEKPAIKIDVPEAAPPSGQPAPAQLPPIAPLLAKADSAAGEADARSLLHRVPYLQ